MPLLTCPHCGSALTAPDAETAPLRCPVCGAILNGADTSAALPIREAIVREEEDDSATRAVAPERMAPIISQATTDHLSARSDEIPSIEARTADETTRVASFAPPVVNATDAHEVTQELPPSGQPVAPPEAPTRRAQGGALRSISLMLAALILVAVIVVAALMANGVIGRSATATTQATATSAPLTPTATPAVTVFSMPGLYQVTYPQGWLIQQRNTPPRIYYALLTPPSGEATVNIEAQQATDAPAPDLLDDQFLRALAQPGTTPIPDGGPTSVTVGGQEWTQVASDVTLRVVGDQPAHYARVIALSTQHGDYVYTIVCLAPSASAAATGQALATADEAYFQPLLASFAFAS